MGFVGGAGNIAIATALPPSFCVLYCKKTNKQNNHDFKYCSLERNKNIVSFTLWKALTLHYDNE